MTREEHNRHWNVNRQPNEEVHCHRISCEEISQYSLDCSACYVGKLHDWEEHDRNIIRARQRKARNAAAKGE